MTNHQQTDEMLPIDERLSRDTFVELWKRIDQLKNSLLRAGDYSEIIRLPDQQLTERFTCAIIRLVATAIQALNKLQHHQARRKATTTAKPPNSEPPHQNAPDRTNAQHVDDPPSTDNLDKLDRQLQRHHT